MSAASSHGFCSGEQVRRTLLLVTMFKLQNFEYFNEEAQSLVAETTPVAPRFLGGSALSPEAGTRRPCPRPGLQAAGSCQRGLENTRPRASRLQQTTLLAGKGRPGVRGRRPRAGCPPTGRETREGGGCERVHVPKGQAPGLGAGG